MRTVLCVMSTIFCASIWASPNFEARKQKTLTMLDQRIAALQEAKTCTTNATADDQLKTCHKALKEDRMAFRDGSMKNREDKLMQKAQKMKERRGKMKDKSQEVTPPVMTPEESTGG